MYPGQFMHALTSNAVALYMLTRLRFFCDLKSAGYLDVCLLMAAESCFDGVPLFLRQMCYTCHANIDACSHPHSHSARIYSKTQIVSHCKTAG